MIHEGTKFSIQEVLGFIKGYVQEIKFCKKNLGGIDVFLKNGFWKPPGLGFIKINFDATFQSDSRTSIVAALARDARGEIRGAVTYLIEDVADAFIAEARACERSLLFARLMGFRCLEVEGDSLTVIKKLFVPRSVNAAAYALAAEGRRSRRSGLWNDGIPTSLSSVLERDRKSSIETIQSMS